MACNSTRSLESRDSKRSRWSSPNRRFRRIASFCWPSVPGSSLPLLLSQILPSQQFVREQQWMPQQQFTSSEQQVHSLVSFCSSSLVLIPIFATDPPLPTTAIRVGAAVCAAANDLCPTLGPAVCTGATDHFRPAAAAAAAAAVCLPTICTGSGLCAFFPTLVNVLSSLNFCFCECA
jgi:hypothetical protein